MNWLIQHLGPASVRHPIRTIVIWGVVGFAVVALSSQMGGEYTDDFAAEGTETAIATDLLADRFPDFAGSTATVVFRAARGVAEHRAAIEEAVTAVGALDHVVLVVDPFVVPGAISTDGTTAFADVRMDLRSGDLPRSTAAGFEAALATARAAGVDAEVGGEAIFLTNQPEPGGAEAIGLVVALVVLVVAFGSLVAAAVPVAVAIGGIVVGSALVMLAAGVVDISSDGPEIATMIGLGVGIDYALFVVSRYALFKADGLVTQDAIAAALDTSGRAVIFAGLTVTVSMLGLSFTGLPILGGIGVAASLTVLVSVAAAITLLPAVLALLGDHIDRLGITRDVSSLHESRWATWSRHVSDRPWRYATAATAVLLALAAPLSSIDLGFPDAGNEPLSTTHRRAYDLLADGFGPGINGPFLVVADLTLPGVADSLDATVADMAIDPGVAASSPPFPNAAGDTMLVSVVPTTSPQDVATADTIRRLRSDVLGDGFYLTGGTAAIVDLTDELSASLPVFVGAVIGLSFLLLMVVFRSVLVPVKAAIMNLLSIGAAYGVMVAVFQWGWGLELLGLTEPVPILSFIPIVMFAILFGLSMDYEVFLLSRIREEHQNGASTHDSVAAGLAGTGRVITSAALIMVSVFLSFVPNPSPFLKMTGIGLAVAVLVDATIVRMVLVPATMSLMGEANWWLPQWLDRLIPAKEDEPSTPTMVPESV